MVSENWAMELFADGDAILSALFVGFLALWTIAVGAAIGSFLNVVIYRMPRKMSLIHPPSRCPRCETPIRPTDNVPILGWLRLRGKCRSCGLPISARYPLVEALVALLLFALAWCELYLAGANLPGGAIERVGFHPLLWRLDWVDLYRLGYHAVLVVVTVAIGGMALDGFPPPRRLVLLVLALGLAVPIIVPAVWPVEMHWMAFELPGLPAPTDRRLVATRFATTGFLGVGAGVVMGTTLAFGARSTDDRRGVLFLAVLVGLFLGWHALATFSLLAGIFAVIAGGISRSTGWRIPITVGTMFALLIQIFAWRWLEEWGQRGLAANPFELEPGWGTVGTWLFAAWFGTILLAGLARLLAPAPGAFARTPVSIGSPSD